MVERVLGALRSHLGAELGLIDDTQEAFLWVLDFPLFLHDEDTGQLDVRPPPVHGARRSTRTRSRAIQARR